MTKIKIMSVRDEDIPYIEEWAEQNNVEVELNKEILTEDNVDDVQGFDGLSLSQQHQYRKMYLPNCNNLALKYAQRSVGFDTYDLNLATQYGIIISNVPSYSPSSIAEFAVTQAINIVRNQNDIQRKLKDYDFRWEPSILSRSISDLTVAVIGTGRIGSIAASILQKDIEVMLLHMIHFLMKRLRNMLSIRIRWKKLYVMQILLQFIFRNEI